MALIRFAAHTLFASAGACCNRLQLGRYDVLEDIVLRIWTNIGEDRVMLVAAGVTFYSLLAVFPAIAALVAIYGLFADPSKIAAHVDSLFGVLPGGALDVIRNQMNLVASQGSSKLGVDLWSDLLFRYGAQTPA